MLPLQCRMARAALGIGIGDLAELAKVSTNAISRFEAGEEPDAPTVDALRAALESEGIIFIGGNYSGAGGPGARLREPSGPSVDTDESQMVQYPEYLEGDGGPGSGG
jgi:transcriptional regulator with XRE-family HTH domain